MPLVLLLLLVPATTVNAQFWNPFAKSDEQRKQEIYKGVMAVIMNETQGPNTTPASQTEATKLNAVDPVEVTNRIFEKEKLEGREFDSWWIEFETKRIAGVLPGLPGG